jgi:hypothetical protein
MPEMSHRHTPIGLGRRRGDALIVGHYVDGVRGHRISQEVHTQQPVPACHDSSPQMRPACLQLWTETLHSHTPMPLTGAGAGSLATVNFAEFFFPRTLVNNRAGEKRQRI